MLFEELKNNRIDYPHLFFLSKGEYSLLHNSEDSFVVHFKESNVYSAEINSFDNNRIKEFISKIKSLNLPLLETTNETIYDSLCGNFKNCYSCVQYNLGNIGETDSNLTLLKKADLEFALTHYESPDYLLELYKRNRVLGYYEDNKLIGYIAHHIDGTLGALYISPDLRGKGYGSKITKAAVAYYGDSAIYSQVIENNAASIQMHVKMNAEKCSKKIYWMYNHGFSFSNYR